MWFHLVRISAPLSASLCGLHECWCKNYKLIHRNSFSEGCHGTVVAIVNVKIGWPVILSLPQCPLSCSQGQCIPAPCKLLTPTGLKMSCPRGTLSCLKESLSCSHVPNPEFLLMLLHRPSLSPKGYSLLRASSLTPSVSLLWNFNLGCPIQNASYLPAVFFWSGTSTPVTSAAGALPFAVSVKCVVFIIQGALDL